jgi:hypothetical protein
VAAVAPPGTLLLAVPVGMELAMVQMGQPLLAVVAVGLVADTLKPNIQKTHLPDTSMSMVAAGAAGLASLALGQMEAAVRLAVTPEVVGQADQLEALLELISPAETVEPMVAAADKLARPISIQLAPQRITSVATALSALSVSSGALVVAIRQMRQTCNFNFN